MSLCLIIQIIFYCIPFTKIIEPDYVYVLCYLLLIVSFLAFTFFSISRKKLNQKIYRLSLNISNFNYSSYIWVLFVLFIFGYFFEFFLGPNHYIHYLTSLKALILPLVFITFFNTKNIIKKILLLVIFFITFYLAITLGKRGFIVPLATTIFYITLLKNFNLKKIFLVCGFFLVFFNLLVELY